MKLARLLITSTCVAPTAVTAALAHATEPPQLETMIVVGQSTNWAVDDEQLEKIQAIDLGDVFRFEPSVAVGGALGIAQKVYVRGLEDAYLHVTVDGAPQTSTLFHHTGRVGIEPELLKQVEVHAGAGEATTGPGALGGAIRFVTKDADDLLEPGRRFGALIKGGYFDNSGGYKGSANVYGRLSDSWSLLGTYVGLDQDDMQDGNGDPISSSGTEQNVGFAKLSGDLGGGHSLALSHERRKEEGEFGRQPDQVTTGDVVFPTTSERETSTLNYKLAPTNSRLLNAGLTLYHTSAELQQDTSQAARSWGIYGGEVTSTGFDLRNRFELGPHRLVVGADYRMDEVSSAYLSPRSEWDWIYEGDPEAVGDFEEEGDVRGVYVQDHYQVNDALLLSFGGRYDWYSFEQNDVELDSSGFSGNAGFQYKLTEYLRLDAGYAQALRGKQVGDTFTLEAAAVDPDLEPEKANNSELALVYNRMPFQGSATVYRSQLRNVIHDQVGRGTFYENVGKLETDGIELKAGYQARWVYGEVAYSQRDTELNGAPVDAYEHRGIGNSIGDTWTLNLISTVGNQFEIGLSGRYVEALENLPVLERSTELGWTEPGQTLDKPSYTVFDAYLQWEPLATGDLQLTLTVQNLFDRYYRDHASVGDYSGFPPEGDWVGIVGVPEPGRDVRFSVSFRL